MTRDIFVFGSNLSGLHLAGAADWALKRCGAAMGQGIGLQGNSYAIPTKGYDVRSRLPLNIIAVHVGNFLDFARSRPEMTFDITPIGCGYAGYKRSQIEPLFAGMPSNCRFNKSWDDHRG